MAGITVLVGLAQQLLIAGADRETPGVSRGALVWEVPDEVAGSGRAEFPPRSDRETRDEVIQLAGGDLWRVLIQLLATSKRDADVAHQPVLVRVGAKRVSAAEIGFPGIEHGTEVEEYNIVRGNATVGALLVVAQQRIGARARNPL